MNITKLDVLVYTVLLMLFAVFSTLLMFDRADCFEQHKNLGQDIRWYPLAGCEIQDWDGVWFPADEYGWWSK